MSASIEQLRELVTRCKVAHPELSTRLDKAATMVITRTVACIGTDLYKVESEAEAGRFYYVALDATERASRCQCPDVLSRAPEGRCKHWLAAQLQKGLDKAEAKRVQAVPATFTARRRAAGVA